MASLYGNYYYIRTEARAVINGVSLPTVSFRVTYSMNRIPTANVELAIGREALMKRIGAVSKAHGVLKDLAPFTPFQIFAKLTPEPAGRAAPAGKKAGFPPGKEFKIFDGFVSGPAEKKSSASSSASLIVNGFGFQAALASTTQYVKGTAIESIGGGAELINAFLKENEPFPTLVDVILNESEDGLGADIWENGIKHIFETAVESLDEMTGTDNSSAQSVIARVNTGVSLPALPLGLDSNIADEGAELLERVLARTLCDLFYDQLGKGIDQASADLWRVLLNASNLFFFNLIPAVDELGVAPVFMGLGGDPHVVIDPSEYHETEHEETFGEQDYSYVTQVALFAEGFQSSPWQEEFVASGMLGFAAIEPSKLPGKRGRTYLGRAPQWMVPPGAAGTDSINPGKDVPDAANPEGGAEPQDPQGKAEAAFVSADFGDTAAATILYDRLFAHRKMNITGRFRCDIAPGSLVRINTVGVRFTGKRDTLFGHVTDVVLAGGTSSNGGYAMTKLFLTNVRSEAEHEELTLPEHPLYEQAWRGGKLSREVP